MSLESENRASLHVFVVIMLVCLLVGAKMVAPYLSAILMGGILSVLAKPLYRRLVLRRIHPTAASGIVTLLVVLVVVGPLLAFATQAVKQAVVLGEWVAHSNAFAETVKGLLAKLSTWAPLDLVVDDAKDLEATLREFVQSLGKDATAMLLELAKGLPNAFLQLFLACLACFFFLTDGRSFFQWAAGKVPLDVEIRGKLTESFRDTAISVVWASMAAAGTQATFMLVAFAALRVPAAALAAGATFVFAWIPLLGSTPVWLAGAGYLAFNGMSGKAIAMVAAGLVTSVIDNFVRPLVLKGRGEMHPLVSLVAIFGGIQLFGILGVFFGPILAAVIITLLTVWPVVGRRGGLPFSVS